MLFIQIAFLMFGLNQSNNISSQLNKKLEQNLQ
jgi:hypothetical protein